MNAKSSRAPEDLGPFQFALLILSVVVLAALVADTFLRLPPEVSRVLHYVDTAICCVFIVDFVLRFRAAPSKGAFLKWGWIDLLASIPNLSVLRAGRFVSVLRLLRLLRGMRTLQRLWESLFARRAHGGITSVALVGFLVVTGGSVGILLFETRPDSNIHSAQDAVWWAMTTITTVGYGDKYPVTTGGRVVAMALMVCGVGLFGTLSGIVASFFLGGDERAIEREESEILAELRQLRADVAELRARTRERS